jgi:two-component system, sporulation sensor kinase E
MREKRDKSGSNNLRSRPRTTLNRTAGMSSDVRKEQKKSSSSGKKTRGRAIPQADASQEPRVSVGTEVTFRLNEAERRYTNLFAHAWDAILIADRQGRIVDANPAACALFGLTRAELLKLNFSHFRRNYSKEKYGRLMDGTLEPPIVRGDHTLVLKTGEKKVLDTVGVKVDDSHAMLIIRDVSSFKQLYEQIAVERKRLYDVFDCMNDPVVLISPHFNIEFLNRRAREFYGDCKNQLCHYALRREKRRCSDCGLHLIISGKEERLVFEIKDKAGRWLETNMTPFVTTGGPAGVILVMRDVSQRRETEEKLRASEGRFRSMIRHAGPGIAYMSLDGKHLDVNDAFCRMTGFSKDELIGTGMPYPYWPEGTAKKFSVSMRRALQGEIDVAEAKFVRRSGESFSVRIHPSFVRDHTGMPVGVIGIFDDISSLEALQEQLTYAQKMQTAGALAKGIAHEFNNLHCGIQWYIELALSHRGMLPSAREDLETALKSLERASHITRQLVTFAGRSLSQKTRARISDIVADTLGLARKELDDDDIDVSVRHESGIPDLVVDPVQIGQVLLNLVLNAKDAMSASKTKKLSISTGFKSDRVFIRVTDSGRGIPEEHIGQIFDSFFTTKEDPETKAIKGFGLGLAVSERIIRSHGGYVEVSSKLGAGSTFTVWLPVESSEGISYAATVIGAREGRSGVRGKKPKSAVGSKLGRRPRPETSGLAKGERKLGSGKTGLSKGRQKPEQGTTAHSKGKQKPR